VTASPGEFSAWRAQVREDDPDRKQIARRLASLPPPARLWGTTPDARASKPGRTGQRGSRAAR
jgi:hypothetical protein